MQHEILQLLIAHPDYSVRPQCSGESWRIVSDMCQQTACPFFICRSRMTKQATRHFACWALLSYTEDVTCVPCVIDMIERASPADHSSSHSLTIMMLKNRFGVNFFWDTDAWRQWWSEYQEKQLGRGHQGGSGMRTSDHYHKWVEWSEEDAAYIGKCPDLITGIHGDDPVRVYGELCEVVEEVVFPFRVRAACPSGSPCQAHARSHLTQPTRTAKIPQRPVESESTTPGRHILSCSRLRASDLPSTSSRAEQTFRRSRRPGFDTLRRTSSDSM